MPQSQETHNFDSLESLKEITDCINASSSIEEKKERITHFILTINEVLGQIEVALAGKCGACENCSDKELISKIKGLKSFLVQEKRKWLATLRQCGIASLQNL